METIVVKYRVEEYCQDTLQWHPCVNVFARPIFNLQKQVKDHELFDPVGGFNALYTVRIYRDLHEESFPDVPVRIQEITTILTAKEYSEIVE